MKYSVLIVNYKTKDDVLLLLDDIKETFKGTNYEVLIVDNASGDKFPEDLLNTKIIYNSDNLGFGSAMNIAAQASRGQFLVLINPDCRLPQDQDFDRFVAGACEKGFGVLAPLIRYPDGRIQPNRGGRSTVLTFVFQALRLGRLRAYIPSWIGRLPIINKSVVGKYLHNFAPHVPEYELCDWVSGAFMVLNSKDFKAVKGFDENFFMYCEDEDLCLRLAKLGKPSLFSSHFEIIHEVGGAQKADVDQRLKFTEIKRLESNIYFIRKHENSYYGFFLRVFYSLFYFLLAFRIKDSSKYLKVSKSFRNG